MSFTSNARSEQAQGDYRSRHKDAVADEDLRANVPGALSQASPVATSTSGGAGYRIDPEGLAAQIRAFEALRDQSAQMEGRLRNAAQRVTPPSGDQPATGQAEATRRSIIAAAEQNKAMAEYAKGLIDSMRKANGTYRQHEENTTGVFRQGSGSTSPIGPLHQDPPGR
ncbi:hypothetical protein ACFWY9_40010 [Amycolatopsis sp. NPDC059027]|uniref:hypothetical protein n=1 Tax=unclassified Amycolatopsis TaxID=2618356 RepID=UPI00366E09F4